MSRSQTLPPCPRCETVTLSLLPARSEEVSCFECPHCHRQYQLRGQDLLTERWMGPLGLLLYPIALSSQPLDDVERVVRHLVVAEGWPEATLQGAVDEAELELQKPSQPVHKIIDLFSGASEEEVRRYLRLVSERLRKELQRQHR